VVAEAAVPELVIPTVELAELVGPQHSHLTLVLAVSAAVIMATASVPVAQVEHLH
jgi:hypothetical protein